MKKLFDTYMQPTPKNMRRLGDSLLAASTIATSYAVLNDMKWTAFTVMIVGVLGKFITNFFKDDN